MAYAGYSQDVSWEFLPSLPEPVSNNAVTTALVSDTLFVYSFAGIDTSKDWFGLHLRSFRYNTHTQVWDTIPDLPDSAGGKIAASANTVKNKIYIIGGYHVASNYHETSSSKVHIFDPLLNTYLPDGADIPVPIDDQVQAVWRDSLIYVISGWSNTTNVPNVQIYDPKLDTWLEGTSVPNNSQYKVFGASGTIIDDTIYYAGGARFGFNFPATTIFRKGYINPDNPTEISWTGATEPLSKGYRMAASTYNNYAIWLGGSNITYNFDGIAYNGSGGVPPLGRIKLYTPQSGTISEFNDLFPPLMDLRGIAKISDNQYILAGGMLAGQEVTDQTLMITIDELSKLHEPTLLEETRPILIYPNPTSRSFKLNHSENIDLVIIKSAQGQIKKSITVASEHQNISTSDLANGIYIVECWQKNKYLGSERLIISQ